MSAQRKRLMEHEDWVKRKESGEGMHGVPVAETRVEGHDGTVVHVFDGYGCHALSDGRKTGEWVGYQGMARLGRWVATTEYYAGDMPEIFTITSLVEHSP